MKVPFSALLLLLFLAAAVTVTAIVTGTLTDELSSLLQNGVPVDRLAEKWDAYRPFFYTTVQQGRLDQADEALGLIRAGDAAGDDALRATGKERFLLAMSQIGREAGFDLCRIF